MTVFTCSEKAVVKIYKIEFNEKNFEKETPEKWSKSDSFPIKIDNVDTSKEHFRSVITANSDCSKIMIHLIQGGHMEYFYRIDLITKL
jgi:hypothetical protein